ncbi:MAG: peptide chain release factor 2 [Anaerolineales bacterium]|nr:peptide chain release factor 2 [Anaerolineales bacterium]
MQDIVNRLKSAQELTHQLMERLDLASKEKKLSRLEKEIEAPDLWDNPTEAQHTMKQYNAVKKDVDSWRDFSRRVHDALELAQLDDESLRTEMETEVAAIEAELEERSFTAMLSGKYDQDSAILAIHAGAGGTDSQDWAEMLERMYLRWAEKRGFETEIYDFSEGEEAGIKSVTIAIDGDYAFGYLRSEKGVHRLVRLSPFDSAHRRHTSFALVEILPQVAMDEADIKIDPSDVKMDVYRSSGAGGQSVQKNATAVRLTHIPTGIVVTCQNERSQTQNREFAMKILRGRLAELKQAEREEERAVLRGEYTKAEWGSQIRSYVLHPYQMVKDHRTDHESGNTQAVLDGDLDEFMEAFLRSKK